MTIVPDQPLQMVRPENRSRFAAGVVVSLILHALAALLLIGGFEGHAPTRPVETVEVEIVQLPPPPVEEPEPQAEELPKPPAEAAPEPESEPEPTPEPVQEQDAEQTVSVIQPVVEFGEEDTIAESGEDGALETAVTGEEEPQAEDQLEPEELSPEPDLQEGGAEAPQLEETLQEEADREEEPVEPEPTEPIEPAEVEETPPAGADEPQADNPQTLADVTAAPVEPGQFETQEEETAAEDPQAEPGPGEAREIVENTEDTETIVAAVLRSKPPAPPRSARRPTQRESSGGNPNSVSAQLRPARRILTGDVLVDTQTRTAMRGMSPRQRLVHLCTTELRAQLNASTPPYFPDRIPIPRARGARTILDTRGWVAFRSYGNWFNVAFRCEADVDVRRISRFSFKVGGPIPRSQWGQRGLPVN